MCDKPRQSQIIEKQKKLKIPRAVLCVLYWHMNVQKNLVCNIYFSRLFLQDGKTPRALALENKKTETANAIDAVHSQHCMRHAHHVAHVTHTHSHCDNANKSELCDTNIMETLVPIYWEMKNMTKRFIGQSCHTHNTCYAAPITPSLLSWCARCIIICLIAPHCFREPARLNTATRYRTVEQEILTISHFVRLSYASTQWGPTS